MDYTCQFSLCRGYRYTLWRQWDFDMFDPRNGEARAKQYLMVVGLNPSTADERNDDPTIRRCVDFAKRWGFGALCMTNLFALRETDPFVMKSHPAPVGADNDLWLQSCAASAGLILAAWGKDGAHNGRDIRVMELLPPMHCLKFNADGSPQHPLYVPALTVPVPFNKESRKAGKD